MFTPMGMSASQARLLSITSRLTNNEFRAQTITNSKLRLATETTQATKAYNEALDAQQLMFMNYDDNGDASKVLLTPALMYEYAPLKNQYTLLNTAGKLLVANLEATNYNETNNLGEFLDRYGLVDKFEPQTKTVRDINPDYLKWKEWYEEWKSDEPDKTNEIYWEETPGSSSSELYDKFLKVTKICYTMSMSYLTKQLGLPGEDVYFSDGSLALHYGPDVSTAPVNRECYLHVLAHLLKSGVYETTTGESLGVGDYGDFGTGGGTKHWWEVSGGYDYVGAQELGQLFVDENYMCCAENAVDITPSSTDTEKLMSDYYFDENGDIQTKSLVQKVVDIAYLITMPETTDQELYDSIQHFVNHDLNVLKEPEKKFKKEEYEDDYDEWKKKYKEPPDEYIERTESDGVLVIINDQDKAQWYTNLWYKMNGSETSNLVRYKTRKIDENTTENIFTVEGAPKNEHGGEYALYDKDLFTDANWLQFALEHGIVSMQQATFEKPCEDGGRLLELSSDAVYWNTIIHTSATDIVSVPNDDAITRAEVEYKKALKKIKAEDKKYDTDLKKLDTEHSALQAEYDAIKETISKNVQRSFKMFS